MNANPYEAATIQSREVSGRRSLWRIVPALFSLLFGVGLIAIVAAVLVIAGIANGHMPARRVMIMGASAWSVAGIVFIAAAVYFWKAKYRRGFYTVLTAVAIISIHAAIDSWIR